MRSACWQKKLPIRPALSNLDIGRNRTSGETGHRAASQGPFPLGRARFRRSGLWLAPANGGCLSLRSLGRRQGAPVVR